MSGQREPPLQVDRRDDAVRRFELEIEDRDRRLAALEAELRHVYTAHELAKAAYEREIERLRAILLEHGALFEAGAEREAALLQSDREARAELQRAHRLHREAQQTYEDEIRRLDELRRAAQDRVEELQAAHGRHLEHLIRERQEALDRARVLRAEIERQWRTPLSRLRGFVATLLRRHRRLIRRWLHR